MRSERLTRAASPALLRKTVEQLASYRRGMPVTEMRVSCSPFYGETGYYVCPRCSITMEREFMAFCDRCGQKLDWKDYKKVRKIRCGRRNDVHT